MSMTMNGIGTESNWWHIYPQSKTLLECNHFRAIYLITFVGHEHYLNRVLEQSRDKCWDSWQRRLASYRRHCLLWRWWLLVHLWSVERDDQVQGFPGSLVDDDTQHQEYPFLCVNVILIITTIADSTCWFGSCINNPSRHNGSGCGRVSDWVHDSLSS